MVDVVEESSEHLGEKYQRWIEKIIVNLQNNKDSSVAPS